MRRLVAAVLVSMMGVGAGAQSAAPAVGNGRLAGVAADGEGTFTLKLNANIVLTNVVVRDKKTGAVVTGLKASRF